MTADGRTLVFVSDRPDGQGDKDLWLAHRPHDEAPWGEPRNLREINKSIKDTFGAISADGRTVFWSPIIGGRAEIWFATRGDADPDTQFAPARPIEELNRLGKNVFPGVSWDWPAEGATLYWGRAVIGRDTLSGEDADIYVATWRPASARAADE